METTEGWKLLVLGAMLVAGFLAHLSGPLVHLPRVSLLLLIGAIFGPHQFGIVPDEVTAWFPFVAHLALAMIGFLLGEEFRWKDIKSKGPRVVGISIGETIGAAIFVFAGAFLLTGNPPLALVLAAIAPASAPAAIFETVREGRAKGELTDTLLGVVAIDDAWGIILFSILLVTATALSGQAPPTEQLIHGIWEISGAVLLGGAIGLPMAWVSNRIRGGKLTLLETSGFVILQTGLATMLGVSYLLAAIVLGIVVINLSQRQRCFKEIEHIREPLLAVFFILAGLKLNVRDLRGVGILMVVYMAARVIGLALGGRVSGRWVGAPDVVRRRIGWCITPQAGVALGFALLAQDRLPEHGDQVLTLIIATTVLFEIAGPAVARWHLVRAGEWASNESASPSD